MNITQELRAIAKYLKTCPLDGREDKSLTVADMALAIARARLEKAMRDFLAAARLTPNADACMRSQTLEISEGCSRCHNRDGVNVHLNEIWDELKKSLTAEGWRIGEHGEDDLCPNCLKAEQAQKGTAP